MLHEQFEEETGTPNEFVSHDDFHSESDGECPPLIERDRANDSDSDNSEGEWANEEDFEFHSCNAKTSSQTLKFSCEARAPSKPAPAHKKQEEASSIQQ